MRLQQYCLTSRVARRVGGIVAVAAPVLCAAIVVPGRALHAQRVLTVVARDTGLESAPTVPAGMTTVRLVLSGRTRRDLVVHRIPAGTASAELARGAAGRPERWFEKWSFGGPAVPRDSAPDASVTLDLRPGRYALVSYEMDAAGRPRGDKYVWREFAAIAMSVLIPGRFAVPDATFKVRDARIDVSGTLRPGQRTLQVENTGSRPHELLIGRLKPGKSIADVQHWSRDKGEPPPFVYVGGVTPMSPGVTAQTRLVLQSGVHVVLCAMRDDRERTSAYERGVISSFKVN